MLNKTRTLFVAFACVASLTIVSALQEKFTLGAPEIRTTNAYSIAGFSASFDNPDTTPADEGLLRIELVGENGERVHCTYSPTTNPTATFLNTALQKANLSTTYAGNATTGSLKHRVCHRLVVMGEATAVCGRTFTGSCTGSVP